MAEPRLLLARQPIYDASLNVTAYELLHRTIDPERSSVVDGDEATSLVLLGASAAAGSGSITEGKPAFINFTEHLIINPPPFDPEQLVIEVLENVPATPAVIGGLRRLREQGFRIALDDFQHHPGLEPLVELADIVKLDVLTLDEVQLRAEVRKLRNYPLRMLAEKIESWEVFNHCVDLGFTYFQGYFLARPQAVHGRPLLPGRQTLLALIAQLADPSVGSVGLATTVAADPMLSMNLIRLVNSPLYRRARPIETLRDGISLLCLERMRGWCYLLLLSKVDGKPRELTRIAMVRARFCELLGERIDAGRGSRCFVLGIVSTLDAFLDQPLAEVLAGMALSEELSAALLEQRGELGTLLATVLGFEDARWEAVPWDALAALGVTKSMAEQDYLDSLQWVSQALAAIEPGRSR